MHTTCGGSAAGGCGPSHFAVHVCVRKQHSINGINLPVNLCEQRGKIVVLP
jgi:hypothetical protein